MLTPLRFRLLAAVLASGSAAALTGFGAHAQGLESGTLDAMARALGFLESAPRGGDFVVAVVYASDAGEDAAVRAGAHLSRLSGPRQARLRAVPLRVEDLLQSTDQIDAIVLTPGVAGDDPSIADFIRERSVVSLSNDPNCLDAESCVLMVNADRDVEIVLDTGLASEVGAQFSTVFTMMVTRR